MSEEDGDADRCSSEAFCYVAASQSSRTTTTTDVMMINDYNDETRATKLHRVEQRRVND